MPREYHHLTAEDRAHFLEHGWLKVSNAIDQRYMEEWMADLWTRLGYDAEDKSTWEETYIKLPRHREVPAPELCPKAWEKIVEIVGGDDKIDPVRERYYGDQFIINFGSEYWKTHEIPPNEAIGWHHDNDWYRQFLDSSGNALTIICCFTDIPARGGGTLVAEDGIEGVCKYLYDHPEGLDSPFEDTLYTHIPSCKKFATIEAKAGDVFITHGLLPHTWSENHLHYARVISNPHVNLVEPFNLNRKDSDYTMCEQVILRALGRESVPEFKPTRPRLSHYPRTAFFKRARVAEELQRMIQAAESKGLGPESVDSIYLKGEEAIKEHEKRNGYDKEIGPGGVLEWKAGNKYETVRPASKAVLV
ncbi:hypothetical protein BCR39DRAFT_494260 [Naematelia encephala]|uniref:Phytanoyl-CoA dioxygenase n=1 Tax=Naematelia encephala TaxID=71784 RepID=A0A1Y2B8I2_9TREE|nr:hypothetical protein BCR39DRAFT_494260 [Naematelia encephala]